MTATAHVRVGVIHGHGTGGSRLAAALGHADGLTVTVAENAWQTLTWLGEGRVDCLVYVTPSSRAVAGSVIETIHADSDVPIVVVSDRLAGTPSPRGVAYVARPRTDDEYDALAGQVRALASRDDLPVVAEPGELVPLP